LRCSVVYREFACGCRQSADKTYCQKCKYGGASHELVAHYERLLANQSSIEKTCKRLAVEYTWYDPRYPHYIHGNAVGVKFQCHCVYLVAKSAVVDGVVSFKGGSKLQLALTHHCSVHGRYIHESRGEVLAIQSVYCAHCVLIYDCIDPEPDGKGQSWKPSTRGQCKMHNDEASIDIRRYKIHKLAMAALSEPVGAATAASAAAGV